VTLPLPLGGVVPPLVSPLLDRDTLDSEGLERLLEHVLAGGVRGVFLLGTTGEGPSLSHRLRRELVGRATSQVKGRAAVLVGITDTAFVETVAAARHAAEVGADAVVLAPPYSMPEGEPELREYLGRLLLELPLPLLLYNRPPLTRVSFDLDTVRWALDQPGIVGIKDSSGDMGHFGQLCAQARERPGWSVLMGPEELLSASILAGGHGAVPGGANLFPRLYVALFEAARAGDLARAQDLQARVTTIAERLYHLGQHPSASIKGIKCALACLGLASDFMAEPFHRFREPERRRIREAVEELRPLVE
jgi:dihydrodipicolinate synthase/N-acetylneuraminate lyase